MPASRIRRFLPLALFYSVLSLACTQLSLLNYLGYEFSVLIALVGSCAAGLLTVSAVRSGYAAATDNVDIRLRSARRSLGRAMITSVGLLILPFVIMIGNSFFVKNCSILEGIGFFLLLALVSTIFSCCVAFFLALLYRQARTLFVLFVAATVLYAIALGYFTPAIFSYNPFFGYFPGLSYDEVVSLSRSLVTYRLCTLTLGAIFVWLGFLVVRYVPRGGSFSRKTFSLIETLVWPRHLWITLLVTVCGGLLYGYRCDLGFETTNSYLRQSLGSTHTTKHFVIRYAPQSFSGEEIQRLGVEHEFQLHQIMEEFALRRTDVIESFVYPSSDVKRRLIGAGTTNIAKPWSNQMHLTRDALESSLKHEMVHVVAGVFGRPIIRASLSTGLVEGLAMAVDRGWGNRTVHQYAAALHRFKLAPDITGLMSLAGFASHAPSVSYVLAGSFCRYLIDRYGIRTMLLVYQSEDYRGVYGRSLEELVTEWRGYLGRTPVKETERGLVDALFRKPPIFDRVCARVIARKNAEARRAFARGEYALAESLYYVSHVEADGYAAFAGYLGSAFYREQFDTVAAAYQNVILNSKHPLQYLPLYLRVGDALWAEGDVRSAEELYRSVREVNLSGRSAEAATLRLLLLKDRQHHDQFLRLVSSTMPDSLRVVVLDSVLSRDPEHRAAAYMKARFLQRMRKYEDAVTLFRSVDLTEADGLLQAMRFRRTGIMLYHLAKYDQAKASFWSSLNYDASDMARYRMEEWIERCEWAAGYDR